MAPVLKAPQQMTMQYLKVDDQTISDLGLFGKSGKSGVFDLFNKTVTRGGSILLEKLFRQPFAEMSVINESANIYRYFSQQDFRFPVDNDTMSSIVYYLENEDVRTQLKAGVQTFGQRFRDMVAADADKVFVNDGVQASLRLFFQVKYFLQTIRDNVEGSAYENQYNALSELISDQVFAKLRQYSNSKFEMKLNNILLSDLDKLIRFSQREKIYSILDILYQLDVAIAVGQVARKMNFHFAEALQKQSSELVYQQVYHTQIENAIANDLILDREHNVLFLTGANMAGKSTLMKSVGIALYLAHMGFPVAAAVMRFAVRDGIFTSINLADDLNAGASHYYAEVLRVKEVAIQLSEGRNLFVIFDELFRGTNVKDAYDATIALTRAFARKQGSQFIISTHIMEAGEKLQEENISAKYQFLPTKMNGNLPVYTRVLQDGITADRQGMIIIQNEGILGILDNGLKNSEG